VDEPPPPGKGENEYRGKGIGLVERIREQYRRIRRSRLVFFVSHAALRRRVLGCLTRTVKSVLSVIRFERLAGTVRFSHEDPAVLGVAAGACAGVRNALSVDQNAALDLRLEPVFDRPCLDGDVEFALSTSIWAMVRPAVVLVVTFPYVTTAWVYLRASRRKRKERATAAQQAGDSSG